MDMNKLTIPTDGYKAASLRDNFWIAERPIVGVHPVTEPKARSINQDLSLLVSVRGFQMPCFPLTPFREESRRKAQRLVSVRWERQP